MLSALVPCLDEAESLPALEAALFPALDALSLPYETLFIDDGSKDGTAAGLAALAARRPAAKVLTHPANRGIGASLKTGLAAAQGDWLVFLDADLTFHPSLIKELLQKREETGADCVSGSPYLGGMPGVPWRRRLPSLALNAFYRGLFDSRLTSYTPMFRLYRTADLRALELTSDGFEVSVEVLVKLLRAGKKIAEVAAPLTVRKAGTSKLRRWRELKAHARLSARLLSS
ncbi:MAG: glycosyltransferase family 2 protein [Elusimicrobia bacterium]|nr:glycosyltransferase family 2 protein [Elusimicrobiota bacterium]